jgi:hypothetical protein
VYELNNKKRVMDYSQFRRKLLIVISISLVAIIIFVDLAYIYYSRVKKITQNQPIAFSHIIHANELSIECNFCHEYIDKSKIAGIPSVQKCMECHEDVAGEKEEIKKLTKYWKDKKPIPWIKVHNLPDHVYFTHKRHIKKNIDCSACHGDVKNMTIAKQVRSLKMGWCVKCHKKNNAPIDCLTCHK